MAWHVVLRFAASAFLRKSMTQGIYSTTELQRAYDREVVRPYNRFISKRFTRFSRGQGTWKHLKPETVEQKRREGSTRPSWILYRSGLMRRNLTVKPKKGPVRKGKRGFSYKLTYGGNRRYPGTTTSVKQVIAYHQRGAGHLPRRRIFVNPSPILKRQMRKGLSRRLGREFRGPLIEIT